MLFERDKDGYPCLRSHVFGSHEGYKFRGTGISGTATKNAATNIEYYLTKNYLINGVEILTEQQVFGDNVHLEIVDTDGILAPAGTVLDRFADSWNMDGTKQSQGKILIPYPAKVIQGWSVRLVYNSVGTGANVDVRVNLFLHELPAGA